MTGYGEVLKALSAIASITSCSPGKNKWSFVDKNLQTFPLIVWGFMSFKPKILIIIPYSSSISSIYNTTLSI